MTLKIYKSKLILAVLLLFILVATAACGGTSDTPAETTENITITPITIASVVTTAPVATTTPATTEDSDDAWKEKVDFDSLNQGYNEITDKYSIRIVVNDIHGAGQKNADAAFAEKHGLFYDEDGYYLGYYPFDIKVCIEDVEMYAKLDEVKMIFSPSFAVSDASDAWKNKITWFNRNYWYDAEIDKYKIRITVSDIHNIGQKNAEEAFAKKTGLEYRPLWMPFFFETWATVEEIETFAKMEEVEKVFFPSDPNDPIPSWKEKVEWGYDGNYPAGAYNEETGKFSIAIFVQDIHKVGQTNAEAAFAEKYGLYYNPNYGEPWILLGWRFIIQASEEEIEMYARLDEVEKIVFNGINVPGQFAKEFEI